MGTRKRGFSVIIIISQFLQFFLVFFSKKTFAIPISLNYTKYKQASSLRVARIQRHLDKINKPPVFTIESQDGDVIDCVHIRRQPALDHPLLRNHKIQHAIAYTTSSDGVVYGAKATINVWDPSVQELNEFSLSQIWVLSGSFDGSDLNSIEAGWQVSPELYGDSRPRLFTYWTSDSYQATGCYNLLCSGFVQTNSRIAIGAAISPVSFIGGNQYDVTILIWKDPKSGNWWLGFGEGTLVGYWPAELFTHLADRATMVEWGGEVVNSRAHNEHTSTQMGSGHFAEDGFGKASFFRNLEIVDSDNSLISAQDITTLAENTNCYNIQSSYNTEWGTHFYYGGPGKNPLCL